MATKICTKCENEFPHTEEYFFKKITKQKLSNGSIAIYSGLRSLCKKCNGEKGNELRVKKRCLKMGCDISDYRENWKKQYSETRTIDITIKNQLSEGRYNMYLRSKSSDINQFFKSVKKSKNERDDRLRKMAIDKIKYFTAEDKRLALRMYAKNERERLTDAYVANMVMKKPIGSLSKEIIETKRLIIQLKRELKTIKN